MILKEMNADLLIGAAIAQLSLGGWPKLSDELKLSLSDMLFNYLPKEFIFKLSLSICSIRAMNELPEIEFEEIGQQNFHLKLKILNKEGLKLIERSDGKTTEEFRTKNQEQILQQQKQAPKTTPQTTSIENLLAQITSVMSEPTSIGPESMITASSQKSNVRVNSISELSSSIASSSTPNNSHTTSTGQNTKRKILDSDDPSYVNLPSETEIEEDNMNQQPKLPKIKIQNTSKLMTNRVKTNGTNTCNNIDFLQNFSSNLIGSNNNTGQSTTIPNFNNLLTGISENRPISDVSIEKCCQPINNDQVANQNLTGVCSDFNPENSEINATLDQLVNLAQTSMAQQNLGVQMSSIPNLFLKQSTSNMSNCNIENDQIHAEDQVSDTSGHELNEQKTSVSNDRDISNMNSVQQILSLFTNKSSSQINSQAVQNILPQNLLQSTSNKNNNTDRKIPERLSSPKTKPDGSVDYGELGPPAHNGFSPYPSIKRQKVDDSQLLTTTEIGPDGQQVLRIF